jgi:hypothetical protein
MEKRFAAFGIAVAVLIVVLALGSWALAQGSDSQPTGKQPESAQPAAILSGGDSQPAGPPEVIIPAKYQPRAGTSGVEANGSEATVYFAPQDENTSATVIFLYNTSDTNATAGLQTFEPDGALYIDTSILVPAGELVRICSDEVSTVSWTWQDVVLVNLTTASAYAKMTLPRGVKAEAYVVWNGGFGYDPLQVVPTLNIRFSTDPDSVFLPFTGRDYP